MFKAEIDQLSVDRLEFFRHEFRLRRAGHGLVIPGRHASSRCRGQRGRCSGALQFFETITGIISLVYLVGFRCHRQLFFVGCFRQGRLPGFPESLKRTLLLRCRVEAARRVVLLLVGRSFLLYAVELKQQIVEFAETSLTLNNVLEALYLARYQFHVLFSFGQAFFQCRDVVLIGRFVFSSFGNLAAEVGDNSARGLFTRELAVKLHFELTDIVVVVDFPIHDFLQSGSELLVDRLHIGTLRLALQEVALSICE